MNGTHPDNHLGGTFSAFHTADGIDPQKILEQLYFHKWIILAISVCTFLIACVFTLTISPQYQTTALVQIKTPSSNSNVLGHLGLKSNDTSMADTEVALLRTSYILEPVIRQNNLNIIIAPHYFPIVGAWMARHYQGNGLAKSFLGLKSYAWGGEKIEIKNFSVLGEIEQSFKLIVGKNDSYQLYTDQGKLVFTGKVGTPFPASNHGNFQLEITTLQAHPGTEFTISYRSPVRMVGGLAHSLQVVNIFGNDPTQSTGIYQLQFTDSNPDVAMQTLNTILNYAVAKNAQQKMEETQHTLQFLSQRLPELKNNLIKTEDAINQYHIQTNTLSMSMTSQLLSQQLRAVEQAIAQLNTQKEELLQVYTPQYPLVIATEHKEAELHRQLQVIEAKIRQFPLINQKEINLLRDSKIKNSMYMMLLNNEQQLEIAKAGLLADFITLSNATPAEKLPAHKLLIMLAGFLMGAFTSIMVITMRSALNKTIENSDHLEDALQIPVQSIVPFSKRQKQLERTSQKQLQLLGSEKSSPPVLAKHEPHDIAIESLRSLRISLHIMFPSSTNKVIALMGSLSNIGKSFVSLNLAQIFADSGKKTLLIDADIRKGRLHHALHQEKTSGLSEYLEEKCHYEGLVRPIHENLFFISCGVYMTHPLALFQSQRFHDLLSRVREEYEQIIIDTPPILPVTDSVLIARHCDTKLFVVSASKDTITDVKQAVKKARAHGIEINGFVLNHRKPLAPYGSNAYYRYAYGEKERIGV